MICQVPLRNKNKEVVAHAIVDADDFDEVMKYRWCLSHNYASGYVDGRRVYLHHFINGNPPDKKHVTDHKNGDPLDNRRSNLRNATYAENIHNTPKRDGSTQYKGVSVYKYSYETDKKKYCAVCSSQHLGLFDDEKLAAIAYDTYSFLLYGPDARNNNLVRYEDVAHRKLSEFEAVKKDGLPKHIYRSGENSFFALKKHNKETIKGEYWDTIDEALEELRKIEMKITHTKLMEELYDWHHTPIRRNKDGIAIIVSAKGDEFLVDDCDWRRLSRMTWYIAGGYVINSALHTRMHRFLLRPKDDEIVDHINGNRLDNRRSNLRIASYSLNNHNRPKRAGCTSKHIGVFYRKNRKKWIARIDHNHNCEWLGSFDTEEEAAAAYQKRKAELYGQDGR